MFQTILPSFLWVREGCLWLPQVLLSLALCTSTPWITTRDKTTPWAISPHWTIQIIWAMIFQNNVSHSFLSYIRLPANVQVPASLNHLISPELLSLLSILLHFPPTSMWSLTFCLEDSQCDYVHYTSAEDLSQIIGVWVLIFCFLFCLVWFWFGGHPQWWLRTTPSSILGGPYHARLSSGLLHVLQNNILSYLSSPNFPFSANWIQRIQRSPSAFPIFFQREREWVIIFQHPGILVKIVWSSGIRSILLIKKYRQMGPDR